MLRTTLRSLWSHKRRLISTCIAVILGVAFMTGMLVLSNTINSVFDDLFGDLGKGVDTVVRGKELFSSDQVGTQRALLDEDTVAKVETVPGVAKAEGSMSAFTLTLLDANGEPMGGFGPPTIVGTWAYDKKMASYQVVEGHEPKADDEVVIDAATVDKGKFTLGKKVTLITPKGKERFELVGISRFGNADSAGGSTFVGTTLATSQALAGEPGKVDTISVRGDPGVTPEELTRRIAEAKVSPDADVVTGKQAAAEQASDVKDAFGFFRTALLIFAAIALFVGWFIISNTFGILVAQRTRELALLRAIGATRSQVLGSVFVEALMIGIVSSVLGFISGVALAKAAFVGLDAIGFGLPSAGLVIEPIVALEAVLVGMVITAIAAVGPAVRATRVPPIAALRDVALDRSGASRIRALLGLLVLAVGVLLTMPAFKAEPLSSDIPGVGLGLGLIIAAVLIEGPILAKPLARLVGAPLPRLRGVTGRIARENAMRSPRRTASTSAALTIGVALVAFITIFATSAQASVSSAVGSGFTGDYIVLPLNQFSFGGVSPKLADEIAQVDGVETVTAISIVPAQLTLPDGGKPGSIIGGIDPATFEQVFTVKMAQGDLGDLGDDEMVVDKAVAKERGLKLGDKVSAVAPGGRRKAFTIAALSDDAALLGQWTVTREAINSLTPRPADYQLGVKAKAGTDPASLRAPLKEVLKRYPTMKLQDRDQFTSGIVQQISVLLNVIYGLLAVSIVIALIGIANTLSLSIHERTRELGLLRAMGMTRSQLRASVRWEATIVALMGTVIGIVLGLGLSKIMVMVLASRGLGEFEVPVGGMVTVVLFGAILGVVASLRPAAKAAKLNVLEAIATE